MKKCRFLFMVVCLALCVSNAMGQTREEIAKAKDVYFSGSGNGSTIDEADSSALNRISEGLKLKVNGFVGDGKDAEKNYRAGDALRCYCWAFSLLKTLPNPDEVTYTEDEGAEHQLVSWLPAQIDTVLRNVKARVVRRDGNAVELAFTFRNKPAVSLDYTYFDERGWSNPYSAKDGRGSLELPDDFLSDYLNLKIEFAYRYLSHIDREVEKALEAMRDETLRQAYLKVPLAPVAAATPAPASFPVTEMKDDTVYRRKIDAVIAAVDKSDYHSVDSFFTADGLGMYNELIANGKARIFGEPQYAVYDKGDAVVARAIPMTFSFDKGVYKSFVEDVVFTFDKDSGKIGCLAFALDENAASGILSHDAWPESSRTTILELLENCKTAYSLKRLDYIERLFDGFESIIRGKDLIRNFHFNKDREKDDSAEQIFMRRQWGKAAYVKKLATCFYRNEYFSTRLTINDIKTESGSEIYEIKIRQDYYSTNYGDACHFILLLDLNDPAEPLLTDCIWQNEPDAVETMRQEKF